jgi:hypothetical protein
MVLKVFAYFTRIIDTVSFIRKGARSTNLGQSCTITEDNLHSTASKSQTIQAGSFMDKCKKYMTSF